MSACCLVILVQWRSAQGNVAAVLLYPWEAAMQAFALALLGSFVPVKLNVCSAPFGNKSAVVIALVILARILRLSCVGQD